MTLKKPKSIRKFISVIPLHRTNNLHYKSIDWFLHNAVFTASNFEQIWILFKIRLNSWVIRAIAIVKNGRIVKVPLHVWTILRSRTFFHTSYFPQTKAALTFMLVNKGIISNKDFKKSWCRDPIWGIPKKFPYCGMRW